METRPYEERDSDPVALYFTRSEALVLYDFLSRGRASKGDDYGNIADQAELRVLWDMAALLETCLDAVVDPDYDRRVAEARDEVRDPES